MTALRTILRAATLPRIYLALLLVSALVQTVRDRTPAPALDQKTVELPRQRAAGPAEGAPVRIAYRDSGTGEPVILLHGSPGSGREFSRLAPLLAESRRALVPDLPGFGASVRFVPDYSIRAHARYVLALMDALNLERAHLVGFSMGSGVALEMVRLAPDRVRSLTMYGGIGIQEGEGSGDYAFEHFKYAVGFGAFVLAPDLLPHFGLLGPRSARFAFIRNFWDSDQRPLRAVLEQVRAPLLILHGRRDPLVPAWTAREHHRLVPHSELVMFDDSHFMLFSAEGSARIAAELIPFLDRVEQPGFVPTRRTRDDVPASQPAQEISSLHLPRGLGPWAQVALIAAATFASEDLTCIAAGLLIRRAELDFFVGLLGCFFGILVGDLGLWLMGRLLGRRVMRWHWVQRRLPTARLDKLGEWFDAQGWKAVIAARFLPGTRFPVYVSAGVLGRSAGRFLFWAALAGLLWTPLLVILVVLFGDAVARPLEAFMGHAWLALLAAAALLLLIVRLAALATTEVGRARIIARTARLWRWEFWPTWLFYIPVYPWIAALALRHRGLTTLTAANPAIPLSGIVGESKYDILSKLPTDWVIPGTRIDPGPLAQRTAQLDRWRRDGGHPFPLILKPDAGQRGAGIKLITSDNEAAHYFERYPLPVLAQCYHPGPFEAGIFYYRLPHEPHGQIFSITDKHFPCLVGDGKASIETLIWRHPRYRMQARVFAARLNGQLEMIPAPGQRVRLAVSGNHCQGTLFADGGHLLSPELERTIDRIARHFAGFYFGRFDVRYRDVVNFTAGTDFSIIELNGATSESTNIYDPSWSLLRAYRLLFRQWSLLYQIGALNRRTGAPVAPLRTLLAEVRAYYTRQQADPVAD